MVQKQQQMQQTSVPAAWPAATSTASNGYHPTMASSQYATQPSASTHVSPTAPAVPPPPAAQGVARPPRPLRTAADPNVKLIQHAEDSVAGGASSALPLAAVVVTICRGNSYDKLFASVRQQACEGTRVSTYTATGRSLTHLLRAFRGVTDTPGTAAWRDFSLLMADIRSVDASSVVFNWECCSGCSHSKFNDDTEGDECRVIVLDLMKILLDRGHMVMCSDFSLKALIAQWSERRFGPNPFVKIGEFGGSMKIRFDSATLAACPSAQLQKVGEMCDEGSADVSAMAATLAYSVDMRKADTTAYTLQILTVATAMPGISTQSLPSHLLCEVGGGHHGAAGHVLLRYPSGGMLLVSSGHWMELTHIGGVSEERLLHIAEASYGQAHADNVRTQFASCGSVAARSAMVQSVAHTYVQQSPPCSMYSAAIASA